MKKRVTTLLTYTVSFCLFLELIARVDAVIRLRGAPVPFTAIQVKDELGVRGLPYGKWGKISLNRYGFNDPDNYTKEEKHPPLRIMCLGDSITFGTYTAPYNWPYFLGQILASREIDAEVINASMPGNTYPQIVDRFEAEYLDFHPDIVIVYKGFRYYMAREPALPPSGKSIWERLGRKSVFIRRVLDHQPRDPYRRLLKERRSKGITSLVKEVTEEQLARYREDLLRLIRLCRSREITLILAPFPTLVDESNRDRYIDLVYDAVFFYPSISADAYIRGIPRFNEITRQVAEQNDVIYVDIRQGLERTKEYFQDRAHLTVEGSRRVAENYAEALIEYIETASRVPDAEVVNGGTRAQQQ